MARSGKAAVFRELNKPVVVETISVDSPKRGEVMVKLAACGVCHSDLSATNGTIALPPPLVLGHEGAGEVVEVGEGVTGLAVGDHVVSSFIYMCGKCRFCSGGRPVLCVEQGKALVTPPEGTPRIKDKDGQAVKYLFRLRRDGRVRDHVGRQRGQDRPEDPARSGGARRLRGDHRRWRRVQHRARRAGRRAWRCSAAAASA